MLVEDDEALRAMLRTVLEKQGYRVLAEGDAHAALARCERSPERIDVVLTDVIMRHMSGSEFIERLEALRPGFKVLYMSGYAGGRLDRQGVLNPGMSIFQKPIAPQVLVCRLRELLGADAQPRD